MKKWLGFILFPLLACFLYLENAPIGIPYTQVFVAEKRDTVLLATNRGEALAVQYCAR